MPKRSLTQLFVDRIGPPKAGRVEYWDTHLPGCGSARVARSRGSSCSGSTAATARRCARRLAGCARSRSVADARKRALASLEKARGGVNPVTEREAVATRAAADELETFAAVAGRFLAEHVERNCRPKTVSEWKRVIEKEMIPEWGTRPIRGLGKGDVLKLLNTKAVTRPMQADEIRKILRRLCSWAIGENLIAADPTDRVAKRVTTREARDRVLSDVEIKAFWAACERSGWPFGPLLKLLLLTGQRREEVGALRWGEFDLDSGTWTIPATRAKNKKLHDVHLSAFALELLAGLPRTGDLLFAS